MYLLCFFIWSNFIFSQNNSEYIGFKLIYGLTSSFNIMPLVSSLDNSYFNDSYNALGSQIGGELFYQHGIGGKFAIVSSMGLRFYNTGIVLSISSTDNINPYTNMYPVYNYDFDKEWSISQLSVNMSVKYNFVFQDFYLAPEIGFSLGGNIIDSYRLGHYFRQNGIRHPVFTIELHKITTVGVHPLIGFGIERRIGKHFVGNLGMRWIGSYNVIGNKVTHEGSYRLHLSSGVSEGNLSNGSGRLDFLIGFAYLLKGNKK